MLQNCKAKYGTPSDGIILELLLDEGLGSKWALYRANVEPSVPALDKFFEAEKGVIGQRVLQNSDKINVLREKYHNLAKTGQITPLEHLEFEL